MFILFVVFVLSAQNLIRNISVLTFLVCICLMSALCSCEHDQNLLRETKTFLFMAKKVSGDQATPATICGK